MIKKLAGQTIFITGASRGIGKAIALRCAQDGANIVIAAKTAEAHPKLPGTIYTAAKEVEAAGGRCLPCIVDVRDEQQVIKAFEAAAAKFGGVDILINNASAIHLTGTVDTPMKRYDLMHSINIRGTFLCSKVAIPYLRKSRNPHILNISPPLSMKPLWFKNHVAYTMAKYGMSMCVLGMAEEFKSEGIAVNALWPVTAIVTAAMEMLAGGDVADRCRKPEIMADAAYVILSKNSKEQTGKFLIDEVVLREAGTTDFDKYAVSPGTPLLPDFFLDDVDPASLNAQYEKHEQFKKQKAGAGSGSGGVAPIFDRIKGLLSPELIKSIGGIYQFELHGSESGSWFLDMKNGKGAVGKGKPAEAAACTMSMDSVDFVKMFSGQLKPTAAFMSGKLKVKGDMGMAMKLDRLMGQLNAKL